MRSELDKFEYRLWFDLIDTPPSYTCDSVWQSILLFHKKMYLECNPRVTYGLNKPAVGLVVARSDCNYSACFNDPKVIGGHFKRGVWVEEYSKPELDLMKLYEETYTKTLPDEVRVPLWLYRELKREFRWNMHGEYDEIDVEGHTVKLVADGSLPLGKYCLVSYADVQDMYTRCKVW